uniref:Uncharacterized protein n=1 Tax=Timema bartmani TaxID=61472 RepID=A0A7R9EWG6_9NEOP|nr:unnamed protein product [Timema bartmani]
MNINKYSKQNGYSQYFGKMALRAPLFDKDNYVNKHFGKFLFTTEGHILPIDSRFRSKLWEIKEGSLDIKPTKQNTTLFTDYPLDFGAIKCFKQVFEVAEIGVQLKIDILQTTHLIV